MSKKYRVMKYNGDDSYSYAIFRSKDVKGKKGVIFYGEATPIASGMSYHEAKSAVNTLLRNE